jgi:hypothetical protein
MTTLNITEPMVGDTITTAQSRELVTVLEVIAHETKSGATIYRVRVESERGERWTSVKYMTDNGVELIAY